MTDQADAAYGPHVTDVSPNSSDAVSLRPTRTHDVGGLTVADVMHAHVESLAPTVTVGELREWFASSTSRRLAVIAADGRYVGSLTPTDVPPGALADRQALEIARDRPTISSSTAAAAGRDLVIASEARRLPVVDAEGRLHGVLAVTSDLRFFACRPPRPSD